MMNSLYRIIIENTNFRHEFVSIFGIISGSIAFIVDLVTFLRLFGVNLIFSPANSNSAASQSVPIKIPTSLKATTFIIWLYAAIAMVALTIFLASRKDEGYNIRLVFALPIVFIPPLFVVWLWGFGYIPSGLFNLYIFLLPTFTFIGMTWYTIATLAKKNPLGCLAAVLLLAPTLLWFQAAYNDWDFIWIIVISFVSLVTGLILAISPVLLIALFILHH